MIQYINGKEIVNIERYEKFCRPRVVVFYWDNTTEDMSAGDYGRNVKRVAPKGSTNSFDLTKSEAYNKALDEGHVGLEATSKQSGLGRWR